MKGAIPVRLICASGKTEVEWVYGDEVQFSEPFFEDTVARLRRGNSANAPSRRPRSLLHQLLDEAGRMSAPLQALIFHVSRCGSTLVAQMLAQPKQHLVLSEPQVLDDILRLPHSPECPDEKVRIRLLQGAVAALTANPEAPVKRVFIKLNCWDIFSLPLLRRAFPDIPCVFVYREPLEVLVSLMRRPSLTLVRGTLSPEQLGVSVHERDGFTPEENAAAVLGALYREAAKHSKQLEALGYRYLPSGLFAALSSCGFTAIEIETMIASTAFDAKNPGERFVRDGETKLAQASAALVAASLKWAEPAYANWLVESVRTNCA